MQTEYELKVLDINIPEVTKKLLALGLKQQSLQPFRRYVYKLSKDGTWARLRTDGLKTKLTYKHFTSNTIDGMNELEIDVSDFDKTHELLQELGFSDFIYQENRRTNFVNNEVEISIDEWPLIPAYLEIEASSKETVEKYLNNLDMEQHKTTSEPTSKVYELYGLDIDAYRHLSFAQ